MLHEGVLVFVFLSKQNAPKGAGSAKYKIEYKRNK